MWHLPDTLGMHKYVSDLMAKMTLEEKIGQLNLPTVGFDVTGPVLSKDVEGKIDIKGSNPLPAGYKTYDWVNDDGRSNLGTWIEAAAKAAGR